MNADTVLEAARTTLTGSLPFPEIVGKLMQTGVEHYQVDYAALQIRFYSAAGSMVLTPLLFEDLPAIAQDFDATALRAAILDSQQNGQKFRQFSQRAMQAGVQGYIAFLHGQRVTYFGRQGDQHTEWFPGAKPESVSTKTAQILADTDAGISLNRAKDVDDLFKQLEI